MFDRSKYFTTMGLRLLGTQVCVRKPLCNPKRSLLASSRKVYYVIRPDTLRGNVVLLPRAALPAGWVVWVCPGGFYFSSNITHSTVREYSTKVGW
jgi:hypothetical protein